MIKRILIELDAAICRCKDLDPRYSLVTQDDKTVHQLQCKLCKALVQQPVTDDEGFLLVVSAPSGVYTGKKAVLGPPPLTKEAEEFVEKELEKTFGKIEKK